jgi:acetyl esterase/lipase
VAPAFIDVGAAEVFRDEAVAYASVLWESGVSAELHVWPGAWHGFDAMAPEAAVSGAARGVKRDWIRRVLRVK